jgi:hypothetical protein
MKKIATLLVPAFVLAVAVPAYADQNQNNDANGNGGGILSSTTVINDYLDEFYQDNGPDTLSESYSESYAANRNTSIAAYQELYAVNSNSELDEVVDIDGTDESPSNVGYNSGNNSVNDNAFAAFAGIANQAWNTGINANTQAATNIAAQGTVNFGVNSGDSSSGSGSGGGDD